MKIAKKIILASLAIITTMAVTTSCMDDQNDWSADTSVIKPYSPSQPGKNTSSLVLTADTTSLNLKVEVSGIEYKNVSSVKIQISESPLSINADELPETYYEFKVDLDPEEVENAVEAGTSTVKLTYVIPRVNDQFTVEENTRYYIRACLTGKDGKDSNWYTNGQYYSGEVSDPNLSRRLLYNTYNYYKTPPVLWILSGEVEEDNITLNWHKTDYATAKTLRNVTLDQSIDISSVAEDEDGNYQYTWSGLTVNETYQFELLDENGEVMGKASAKTEYAPNMDLAMSITVNEIEADVQGEVKGSTLFRQKGVPYTITSSEVDGKTFTVKFLNEDSHGWTTPRNDWVANPVKQAIDFSIRAQLKKSTSAVVTVPSSGRLYIYGYNPTTITVSQQDQSTGETVFEEAIETSSAKKKYPDADGTDRSSYPSYMTRISAGEATVKIGEQAFYFYGFCFVPDDPNAQ